MAHQHSFSEILTKIADGSAAACCETEFLVVAGIVLVVTGISAICAPFLNPGPSGD